MTIHRAVNVLPVLTLILISATSAIAWDEVGHKLSAYIAWQRMTPEVRERVFDILMKAPEDSHLNTPYDAFNSRSDSIKKLELFMHASIWPDVVKNRAFEVRNSKYNQSNWHYGSIFWKQENKEATILKDFKGAGGLAIPKLADFERVLRGSSYKDEEKALAIAWFLHVGGDLHNPLHNASRVTKTEPEGDQGGNLFVLVPRTDKSFGVNLHSYWDSIIGRVKPRKNDAWDSDYLIPIGRKMMKKHRFKSLSGRLYLGQFEGWNKEGFGFLNLVVYEGIERESMPSKKYRKRAYKTARKQITLAGYRIGETLNQIFSKTPEPETLSDVFPKNGNVPITTCRVIRNILYPVSKRKLPDQRRRIALLNTCPPNRGKVARPTTRIMVDGEPIFLEYDVVKVFENEKEARAYAKANDIEDVKVS